VKVPTGGMYRVWSMERDISKSKDFGISFFLKKIEKTLDLELTPRSKMTLNIETTTHCAEKRG
jgi:hypothetical protein